jgi:hypothetical protein
MLCYKLVYQRLVNLGQLDLAFGQPERKMANAAEMALHSTSAKPVPVKITDISVGTPAQHARAEPILA